MKFNNVSCSVGNTIIMCKTSDDIY